MSRILIVEDDIALNNGIVLFLRENHFDNMNFSKDSEEVILSKTAACGNCKSTGIKTSHYFS